MSKLTRQQQQELGALSKLSDDDINTTNIAELNDWTDAERARFYRPLKTPVTIRLDADVLAWFKSHSDKYQTAINKALREYISSH